jgi:hypothetical protein
VSGLSLAVLLFLGACGDRRGADCETRFRQIAERATQPLPAPLHVPIDSSTLPTGPATGTLGGAGGLRVWIGPRGVKIHQEPGWVPLRDAAAAVTDRLGSAKVVEVGVAGDLLVADVMPVFNAITDKAALRLVLAPPADRLALPPDTPAWARERIAEVEKSRESRRLAEGLAQALGTCTPAREAFGRLAAQGPDRLRENLGATVDAARTCGCQVVDAPAFDALLTMMLHVRPPPGWRHAPLRRRGGAPLRLAETATVQELVDALVAGPAGDRTIELSSSENP